MKQVEAVLFPCHRLGTWKVFAFGSDREGEGEGGADVGRGIDEEIAAHALGEVFREGQSDAGSTGLALRGRVGLPKSFENVREFFGSEADAVVGNNEVNSVLDFLHGHGDASAAWSKLQGVDAEVEEDFFEAIMIEDLNGIFGKAGLDVEADLFAFGHGTEVALEAESKITEVDVFESFGKVAGVEAGDVEEVIDHPHEAEAIFRKGVDVAESAGVFLKGGERGELLDGAEDESERSAELVTDIRKEAVFGFTESLQLVVAGLQGVTVGFDFFPKIEFPGAMAFVIKEAKARKESSGGEEKELGGKFEKWALKVKVECGVR